jgi:hypothetical protein
MTIPVPDKMQKKNIGVTSAVDLMRKRLRSLKQDGKKIMIMHSSNSQHHYIDKFIFFRLILFHIFLLIVFLSPILLVFIGILILI